MYIHIGSRAKQLVDKYYKGSKKDFAKAIELKQTTYLFQLFKKEDIGTDVLKRMASVLDIDFILFFREEDVLNILNDPPSGYGKPQVNSKEKMDKLVKALENTIKSQEVTIKSQEITIGILQKEEGIKMSYEKRKK